MIDHHCSSCSASLTKKEEEEEKQNRDLPGCWFATLVLISGDIDIIVGQGSTWKQQVGA